MSLGFVSRYADHASDYFADCLVQVCRSSMASEIGGSLLKIQDPTLPLFARVQHAVTLPFSINGMINKRIEKTDNPAAVFFLKNLLTSFTLKMISNRSAEEKTLIRQTLALVSEKFLEWKIDEGLTLLYTFCNEQNYLDCFREFYRDLTLQYPNLKLFIERQVAPGYIDQTWIGLSVDYAKQQIIASVSRTMVKITGI